MYRESKPDDEEFLLGRRIDKIGDGEDNKEGMNSSVLGLN